MSVTTRHREANLEDEICAYLAANGWLYSSSSEGYDKELTLFPEDVLAWLEETQPEEFAKIVKPDDSVQVRANAERNLLKRLRATLNLPLQARGGGGVLQVLRHGFSHLSAKFQMSQVKPATSWNPVTLDRYEKTRLRVVRQVYFSTRNRKSIDLVLFVNGIPVATLELKTDLTQSVDAAVFQYKKDRPPAGEPLLQFGRGALVHFAVSNSDVQMTTKLAGPATRFLPFNQGHDEGAGNPPNPDGSQTAFLWEEIFQKDMWLLVLHRFMQYQREVTRDYETGERVTRERIIFPRYHQLRAVTRLIETAREEGPGHRYLVQHSAGSGKTNSISWLAHQLSGLHDENNEKIFDTVIVVTDRTVLDSQLREAIWQIDHQADLVAAITRESGMSKSQELVEALTGRTQIVVVTIQTFLPAMELIRESEGLAGRTFAVIADEAHSSQTGTTAGALTSVLTTSEQEDLADGGGVDTEALLELSMRNAANAENISFFAFTATPKAKTVEIFGRLDEHGIPRAFDVYSMQQAIEEEFILDVLKSYTPYRVAWRLAHNGEEYDSTEPVDEETARKGLLSWVRLHPTNISQKVKIIVEHFRENVAHLLDGNAKAMVVTGSRKEAVRYKHYLEKYVHAQGYDNVRALVAFSGTVNDPEIVGDDLTEANMNPGIRGQDLAEAFRPSTYNVMIVANKFQTGFDQPRLVAMYVDKRLGGVQAVQTLSRLNRTHPGKEQTFILDFVNEAEDILEAFKPYYRRADITASSDPNLIHDLAQNLDSSGLYTPEEMEQVAEEVLGGQSVGANSRISAIVSPIVSRFQTNWAAAKNANDAIAQEQLLKLRSDVNAYINFYDFISQIINLEDPDLLRRQLLLRLVRGGLKTGGETELLDLSAVSIEYYKITEQDAVALRLEEGEGLEPITAVGTGQIHEKHRLKLDEIIQKLNDRFSDQFEASDIDATMESVITSLSHDKNLQAQARVNSEAQFAESTRLEPAVQQAFLSTMNDVPQVAAAIMADNELFREIINSFPVMMYQKLRSLAPQELRTENN